MLVVWSGLRYPISQLQWMVLKGLQGMQSQTLKHCHLTSDQGKHEEESSDQGNCQFDGYAWGKLKNSQQHRPPLDQKWGPPLGQYWHGRFGQVIARSVEQWREIFQSMFPSRRGSEALTALTGDNHGGLNSPYVVDPDEFTIRSRPL